MLKVEKASGVDGIMVEMLKNGGEIVTEWMQLICNLARKQYVVPEDWVKPVIVLLFKGKGAKDVCINYRGMNLLSIP